MSRINEKQKKTTKEYRDNYDDIFIRGKNSGKATLVVLDECDAGSVGVVEPRSKSQRKRLEAQRVPRPDSLGKSTI